MNEIEVSTTGGEFVYFTVSGATYKTKQITEGYIQVARYDGPKLGWSETHSLRVKEWAKEAMKQFAAEEARMAKVAS